jgi:hypothetical protein
LGGDILGFIGENFRESKGVKVFYFSFSQGFFYIMEFQWVQRVNNLIKLKELQIVSEDLRDGDNGLGTLFFFSKRVFLGEEKRMG